MEGVYMGFREAVSAARRSGAGRFAAGRTKAPVGDGFLHSRPRSSSGSREEICPGGLPGAAGLRYGRGTEGSWVKRQSPGGAYR